MVIKFSCEEVNAAKEHPGSLLFLCHRVLVFAQQQFIFQDDSNESLNIRVGSSARADSNSKRIVPSLTHVGGNEQPGRCRILGESVGSV